MSQKMIVTWENMMMKKTFINGIHQFILHQWFVQTNKS